jgi:hypothetical protein
MTLATPRPFSVQISNSALQDLRLRLGLTRWPQELTADAWEYGMPVPLLKRIITHWHEAFDWRSAESKLNRLPQYLIDVDGHRIHYVHVRGVAGSTPLILTHGWPGSFVEMVKIIPLLTDPANNGFAGCPSFDVVAPSLPGFGFSPAPTERGMSSRRVAQLWHALMQSLGYDRYFAQGGDIGAGVSSWLARLYPEAVRGLHLNFTPGNYQPYLGPEVPPLSPGETAWQAERSR